MKTIVKVFAICLLFAAPAFSDQLDAFNFNGGLGNLGKVFLLKNGAVQLSISGFDTPGIAGNLWEKNDGPTEFGIGLQDEVDREIGIAGTDFVQIDMTKLDKLKNLVSVQIGVNSIQWGENYDVWGSNTAGVLGTLIVANDTTAEFSLPTNYDFISLTAGRGNVLLDNVDVVITPTPEPSTFVMFAIGIALLGVTTLLKRRYV